MNNYIILGMSILMFILSSIMLYMIPVIKTYGLGSIGMAAIGAVIIAAYIKSILYLGIYIDNKK
jgi:hypothetical protein